jgi:uncharacterized protein (DUF1810 family)
MLFIPEKFINMQKQDLEQALTELNAGQKKSHWIWYIFPQLKEFGFSDMAKRYGIKDLSEACEYLKNPILLANYHKALKIVCTQLLKGTSAQTLMGSEVDEIKLKRSVTLFKMALEKLLQDQANCMDYQELHKDCIDVLKALGGDCQATINFINDPPNTELRSYITKRTHEWTYHYNFLGLVALFYWLKDALTGSNDLRIKSKEIKISAANKLYHKKRNSAHA